MEHYGVSAEPVTTDKVLIAIGIAMDGKNLAHVVAVPIINGAVRMDCVFDAKPGRNASLKEVLVALRQYCGRHPVGGLDMIQAARTLRKMAGGWPSEVTDVETAAIERYGQDGLKKLKAEAGVKVSRQDLLKRVEAAATLLRRIDIARRLEY